MFSFKVELHAVGSAFVAGFFAFPSWVGRHGRAPNSAAAPKAKDTAQRPTLAPPSPVNRDRRTDGNVATSVLKCSPVCARLHYSGYNLPQHIYMYLHLLTYTVNLQPAHFRGFFSAIHRVRRHPNATPSTMSTAATRSKRPSEEKSEEYPTKISTISFPT